MEWFSFLFFSIQGLIITLAVIIILFLIVKRVLFEKEDFEKRDN